MLLVPEAVVHPSFQMSFAATLALIATYERGMPWAIAAAPSTALAARVALWGAREVVLAVLASLVAGFATMPYAAYHFHRLAPYGVRRQPAGDARHLRGVDAGRACWRCWRCRSDSTGRCWQLMGVGIDWMVVVARGSRGCPARSATFRRSAAVRLLLGTAGLIVLCLLRIAAAVCRRRVRIGRLRRGADGAAARRADLRRRATSSRCVAATVA